MKSAFWRTDWFLGLGVVVAFAVFSRASDLIPSLERKAYDLGVAATARTPSDRIAVIAIDDASLENIGRWPWSREVLAQMTEKLAAAKAKVIGNTVLFSEPQIDPGYVYVTKLLELVPPGDASPFTDLLKEAEAKLNTDRKLAASFAAAGNVLQPMLFTLGEPLGKPDRPLPEYVTRNALTNVAGAGEPLPSRAVQVPIEPIARSVAAIGHLNQLRDLDGAVRSEPLVVRYYEQFYPSLSVMIAARYLNLAPGDIKVTLGEGIALARLRIGTDPSLLMHTYFYRDSASRPAFAVDSFFDVYTGKIPLEKYRDRIVLIGATAAGLGDAPATPVSSAMPPVLTLAHAVSSILQEHFFLTPLWAYAAELAVILLIAAYIVVVLPRLQAGPALVMSGAMFATLIVAHFALMVGAGMWLQLMLPATLLLVGHAALVSKRFIVTEAAKQKSDESSAESNRMLGLAYQGQGQLDLAWDKFRQVPMSPALADTLYNLALDFERKRQFNKAESVFRSLHEFDPKFKDVAEKVARAKQLSETVILGGASSHPGGTLHLGVGTKPKFGRFEVEKELGKGAMGVVYLGKDPKIGREVAIKTLALAQEFEPEELAGAKERFFREAQTAGRLSHPNIVTIYDTGEEHDFCYIAMELLKGGDLAAFTKPGTLLPLEMVVSIVARAADALGYAHREGVVHRDVKPANLMWHRDTDSLKVTDFGIARLTASSKTKTGMVLGTPSYMSPEQLAGKRVDGRSDLFSLAVALYQMLAGRLPFEGESMAQLMFKIANEAPADIRSINPDIPEPLAAFLERALAKNPDERFQTGEEFGGALRATVAVKASGQVDIEL
ncbi:MAG: CHASE2 domain-containing protein [Betaproteobacteria bacterium]|nr:CHASE2 domain-containing protein [Betaproteobacteria bacterium]